MENEVASATSGVARAVNQYCEQLRAGHSPTEASRQSHNSRLSQAEWDELTRAIDELVFDSMKKVNELSIAVHQALRPSNN